MNYLTKERKDLLVEQLVGISGWIVSCKTKAQVKTCVDMLDRIHKESYGGKDARLIYNLGITTGIVQLQLHYMKKEQKKLAESKN